MDSTEAAAFSSSESAAAIAGLQRGQYCLQFEDATLNALASGKSSPLTALNTDQRQENNALIAVGSVPCEFPKPLNMFKIVDLPASVYDWTKSSSTDANQSSARKKRLKTSKNGDDDKRCNCQKTRCLKLYCECFSSQYFCDESTCSCRDCGNTPENEEEVTYVKEEIGSRKPLAFAPKIVECGTDVPWNNINMEGVNLKIPSSTMHRRGCNCLKSKCQKKYCQCFEANVGCTSACRCQGCDNIHGSKREYRAMEDAAIMERFRNMVVENTSDSRSQNKPEMVANMTNLLHNGSYGLNKRSFLTPPLQCSYQGTEAANSHVVSGNHLLPSPSSNVTTYPPQLTNEMVACNWQLEYNNVNMPNQTSPGFNSLNNASQPTPHFYPQSPTQASLFTNHPQSQLSHGNSPLISGGSFHWNLPITPMTILGDESKHVQRHETDSRILDTPNEMQVPSPQSQPANFMLKAPPSIPPGTSSPLNSE